MISHREFSRVYDNFKCLYKKVWKIIEGTTYIYIYIYTRLGRKINLQKSSYDPVDDFWSMGPNHCNTKVRILWIAVETMFLWSHSMGVSRSAYKLWCWFIYIYIYIYIYMYICVCVCVCVCVWERERERERDRERERTCLSVCACVCVIILWGKW